MQNTKLHQRMVGNATTAKIDGQMPAGMAYGQTNHLKMPIIAKYINEVTIMAEHGTIHYTTNGNTPTSDSDTYTEPITIAADTTVKAIAVMDGAITSAVASKECSYVAPASKPDITCTDNVVTMTAEEGAAIHYTDDNSTPDVTSDVYEEPITITETTTYKAIAVVSGKPNSGVKSKTCTYVAQVVPEEHEVPGDGEGTGEGTGEA